MTRKAMLINLGIILAVFFITGAIRVTIERGPVSDDHSYQLNEIVLITVQGEFHFYNTNEEWFWKQDDRTWPLIPESFNSSPINNLFHLFFNPDANSIKTQQSEKLLDEGIMVISRDQDYIAELIKQNIESSRTWQFSGKDSLSLIFWKSPLFDERIQIVSEENSVLLETDHSIFPEALFALSDLLQLNLSFDYSSSDLIGWKRIIPGNPEYNLFWTETSNGWKNAYSGHLITDPSLKRITSLFRNWTAWAPEFEEFPEFPRVILEFYFADNSEYIFEIGQVNAEGLYPVRNQKSGIVFLCSADSLEGFLYANEYYENTPEESGENDLD